MHKFFILVEHNRDYYDEYQLSDGEWNDRFEVWDDPYCKIVACKHEKFEDNLKTFPNAYGGSIDLLEDLDGKLYAINEHYSELEIMMKFSGYPEVLTKMTKEVK